MSSVRVFVIVLSIMTLIVFSCSSDNPNLDSNTECSGVSCSLEYRVISVSIVDGNQNPVALDAFEVINLEENLEVTLSLTPSEFELAQNNGSYPLVVDRSIGQNQEIELLFRGIINNEVVITANYVVGEDCCHVYLVDGDLNLIF